MVEVTNAFDDYRYKAEQEAASPNYELETAQNGRRARYSGSEVHSLRNRFKIAVDSTK